MIGAQLTSNNLANYATPLLPTQCDPIVYASVVFINQSCSPCGLCKGFLLGSGAIFCQVGLVLGCFLVFQFFLVLVVHNLIFWLGLPSLLLLGFISANYVLHWLVYALYFKFLIAALHFQTWCNWASQLIKKAWKLIGDCTLYNCKSLIKPVFCLPKYLCIFRQLINWWWEKINEFVIQKNNNV